MKIAITHLGDSRLRRYLQAYYVRSLKEADAEAVVFAQTLSQNEADALMDRCDGLLLPGGADISPACYQEKTLPCCHEVNAVRDAIENAMLARAMSQGKPVVGICRGFQLINAALGGTLFQDIATQTTGRKKHDNYPFTRHGVEVAEGTVLHSLLGVRSRVNSMHHQAVKELAHALRVAALCDDGTIEAAEHKDYPFLLGVQWHPELLSRNNPKQAAIFRRFIEACR